MLAPALLALALQGAASASPIDGQCRYGPELTERARQTGTVLTTCNTFAETSDGAASTFVFGRRSWSPVLHVTGTMKGSRMEVTQLRLRSGDAAPASGDCEKFYRDGEVSRVACLVRSKGIYHTVNFVRTRI